jgi:Tfp pilus assembly protein PilF
LETEQVESENLKTDTSKREHSGKDPKVNEQASAPAPKTAISPPLVQKNYLGILLPNESKELIAVNTFPDSPARTAGIQMGDRLLEFDNRNLKGVRPETFAELVRTASPKKPLELKVKRGGSIKTLNIALERLPEERILEKRNAQKKEARTYYQKAEEQKKQKNYKAAEPLYARAISLDPTQTLSYDYRAYCLDKTGRRKSGYKLLEMSLLLENKMYNNYLYGKFLSYDKKYRQAVPYLEKASKRIDQGGTYYFPFHELGGAKFMLDDHKGAIEALLISEKMGDSKPLTFGTLGVCFDKTGDKKRAIAYYRRYLSMNDSNQQMKQMARTRLAKLERGNSHHKKSSDKSFSKMFNLIIDEVQKGK